MPIVYVINNLIKKLLKFSIQISIYLSFLILQIHMFYVFKNNVYVMLLLLPEMFCTYFINCYCKAQWKYSKF